MKYEIDTNICNAARNLIKPQVFEQNLHTFESTYDVCERAWEKNLERLRGIPIKYLLVCEAPPFPSNDTVSYFYKTFDNREAGKPVGWIISILNMLSNQQSFDDVEDCLAFIASKQILLIDSVPIAWKYTSAIRRHPDYIQLIKASVPYLNSKLNHPNLTWAEDVKIALGFKLNALGMIEVYKNGINLPNGQNIKLSEDLIIANGSGYPSAKNLKTVWAM